MQTNMVVRSFWVLGILSAVLCGCGRTAPYFSHRPTATEVMRRFSDTLSSCNSFRVTVDTSIKFSGPGINEELSASQLLALRRPNRMAIILKEGIMGATIVDDGTDLYTYVPALDQQYTVTKAPASPTDVLGGTGLFAMGMQGQASLLMMRALCSPDPYKVLAPAMENAVYAGRDAIDGMECDHLKCPGTDGSWEVWVQQGAHPLLRRLVPDMTKIVAKMSGQIKGLKVTESVDYKDWAVGTALPASLFEFKPPAGAIKVDSFYPKEEEKEPHPLLGQAAPEFQLPLLDGGHVDVKDLKGKKVVVLDFWAT